MICLKLFEKSKARRSLVEPARKGSEFARPSARKLACHAGFPSREIVGRRLEGERANRRLVRLPSFGDRLIFGSRMWQWSGDRDDRFECVIEWLAWPARRGLLGLTWSKPAAIDPAPSAQVGMAARVRGVEFRDDQAYLSAPQSQPGPHPRLPSAHGHPQRPQGRRCASPSGPQASRHDHRRQVSRTASRVIGRVAIESSSLDHGQQSPYYVRPQGFPARLRIKQRREFLQVQQGGRKHHVRHFMVFVSPRQTTSDGTGQGGESPARATLSLPTRLGITITRKIGNAVERNRIKRLVREVFRLHRVRLPEGLDLVWVAKQQAAQACFADVLDDFEALARRLDPTRSRSRSARSSGGSSR